MPYFPRNTKVNLAKIIQFSRLKLTPLPMDTFSKYIGKATIAFSIEKSILQLENWVQV